MAVRGRAMHVLVGKAKLGWAGQCEARRGRARFLMTAFNRLLRRIGQSIAGSYYEGEEPPARFADIVEAFALTKPAPTRAQWAEFARKHAEEAYRQGWVRGWERAERGGEPLPSTAKVEEMGRQLRVLNGDEAPAPGDVPPEVEQALDFDRQREEWFAARAGVGPRPSRSDR
jgi:hypothetical protein